MPFHNDGDPLQYLSFGATFSRTISIFIDTLFCLWFLNTLVNQLLSFMFMSGDADVMDVLFAMEGILLTALPMLVFFPLHAILETVVYLNLRVGRESLNHQVLSDDLKSLRGGGILRDNNNNSMSSSPIDYQPIQELDGGNELAEYLMPRIESV